MGYVPYQAAAGFLNHQQVAMNNSLLKHAALPLPYWYWSTAMWVLPEAPTHARKKWHRGALKPKHATRVFCRFRRGKTIRHRRNVHRRSARRTSKQVKFGTWTRMEPYKITQLKFGKSWSKPPFLSSMLIFFRVNHTPYIHCNHILYNYYNLIACWENGTCFADSAFPGKGAIWGVDCVDPK